MKETHRSHETKERFKKAFFTLYAEKKIETITIKEVADLAGFNRGTFYLYYKSIYDLLQKTEQELLDEFAKKVDYHINLYYNNIGDPNDERYIVAQEHFISEGEYVKVLNGENGDPRFKSRMKNIIKDAYRKHLTLDPNKKDGKFEYLLEYLVEANISIIQYWLVNREKDLPRVTIKEVGEIMEFVSKNGFKKAFECYMLK